MKSIKINITVPDTLLEKMDDYAKANAMTRSGLIQLATSQYIQAQEMMPSLNNAFALMGSLAKRSAIEGGVDSAAFAQELAQLEDCQRELMEKPKKKKSQSKTKSKAKKPKPAPPAAAV